MGGTEHLATSRGHPLPLFALLDELWQLRHNMSAYDASYVALAEALDCVLVAADARLIRSPQAKCTVTMVARESSTQLIELA